jgi:hypothetical protein
VAFVAHFSVGIGSIVASAMAVETLFARRSRKQDGIE